MRHAQRSTPRRHNFTRWYGWEHGINHRDMFAPQDSLCDMYPARRLRSSDMFFPQGRLLRHVPGRPALLQRHVLPAGPATATCARPAAPAPATCSSRRTGYCDMYPAAEPAPATCSSRRTGYCDMYPAGRLCSSDMFFPEDRLLRHVTQRGSHLGAAFQGGGDTHGLERRSPLGTRGARRRARQVLDQRDRPLPWRFPAQTGRARTCVADGG